jgi:hypothetical protein
MKNWCQYLTLIHCTLSPLFVVFATSTALGKRTVAYLLIFKVGYGKLDYIVIGAI